MIRDGEVIGSIGVCREEPGLFADKHVRLLQIFADQAVIAIENVRLFEETKESLEQQKATADILRCISSSMADTQPVFDKILDSCKHLFGGDELDVLLVDEQDRLQVAAYVGKARETIAATFPAPVMGSAPGRAITERRVVHYADVINAPDIPSVIRRMGQIVGYHSVAFAPMLWEDRGIGVVGIARSRGAFSDRELALLQTFADQAVIATGLPISNSTFEPDNDFLFGTEDPQGLRCPLGAHIRRANPRESFEPGSHEQIEITNRHRIIRVGRFYAPEPVRSRGCSSCV